MTPAGPIRLGVDIGGTKIACAVVDSGGQVLTRERRPTPRTGGDDVLAELLDLIAQLRRRHHVDGIGIGAPGVIDGGTGRVVSASAVLPGWAGTEVGAKVAAGTGLPVAVDNDVRAMALGEARHGAGAGIGRVLFASVGTGVGGALVFRGALQRGSHGTAGEIAHLLVPGQASIACGCGRRDHLEAMASGPAIAAGYALAAGIEPVDLPQVVARWRAGDEAAGRAVVDAAELLGRALAGLAGAVDVDALVVGGGVAQIGPDFLDPLRAAFAASVIEPLRGIPVLAAALGTDAPLIGAAELVEPGDGPAA